MIRSALLTRDGLAHGLTTKAFGAVGPVAAGAVDTPRHVAVRALGGVAERLVVPHQVHGANVALVSADDAHAVRGAISQTDGVVTAHAGVTLMVQGADCPLFLLHDADARVLGVVHSGWRGTVAAIGAEAVRVMTGAGARPDHIAAAVFPGIGPCCFEVGPEVRAAFVDASGDTATAWFRAGEGGRWLLDLHAAIEHALAGADVTNVDLIAGCTACDGRLFSHRASGGAPERHGLFAMMISPRRADRPRRIGTRRTPRTPGRT